MKIAAKGQRSIFRNNYLAILILLLSLNASAQYDSTKTILQVNGDGFRWKHGQFMSPVKIYSGLPIMALRDSGSLGWYRGRFWQWSGSAWDTLKSNAGGSSSGSGTVNNGTQYRIGYYATTGTAISPASAITASRLLVSDANGVPTHTSVTTTEAGYLSGVTSAIQTQFSGKLTIASNLSDVASASTSRANLGATTVGGNFFTLINPSAVTWPRMNADNTITARTAAQTLSDLGGISSVPINTIIAATGTNTINHGGFEQEWQWNSQAGGPAFKLSSSSTAATGNTQAVFGVSLTGANSNSGQTTFGGYFENLHTGTTPTNVALRLKATGGTNNVALQIPKDNGRVAIGQNTSPYGLISLGITNDADISQLFFTDFAQDPTPLQDGMAWRNGTHLYYRNNGSTIDLTAGGVGTTTNALTIGTNLQGTSSTFNGSAAVTVSLQNAAADGSTKGAAGFGVQDFSASSGIVTSKTTVQALTDGSTITMDANSGPGGTVTPAGNRTLVITNMIAGHWYWVRFTQDGTAGRVHTLPGGGTTTAGLTIGAFETYSGLWDGSTWEWHVSTSGTPLSNSLTSAHLFVGNGSNIATDVAVTGDVTINNSGVTAIASGVIVNADINASAAIAYSKLNLSTSIVNADVSSSAAIAYSKLNLTGAILNADLAGSIADGKLASSYVYADGTRALTGNWNAGAFNIASTQTAGSDNTVYDGFKLSNTKTASSGNQEYSPDIIFSGTGWKTNSTAASQTVDFRNYMTPIQSSANPKGAMIWDWRTNGGSYAPIMSLTTATSAVTLDLGEAGVTNGIVKLEGSTSGYVKLFPQAAAGNATLTLPASSSTLATIDLTETFSNKRWTARIGSTTSSATPTINTDNYDVYKITAQAAAITSFTTNLSGTPVDGDILEIQITDDGTARAITWGASFVSSSVTLPATTVVSTTLTTVFQYYTTSSYGNNKYVCVNTY